MKYQSIKPICIAVIAFFLLFFTSSPLQAYPGKVVTSYEAPGKICTGITFDGKLLWVADRKSKSIYAINPSTGKKEKELPSPAYWPMGMTWDGEALWNIDCKGGLPLSENYSAIAYRIDPETGQIKRAVHLSVGKTHGCAWDGKYLWVADDGNNQIVQVNAHDGTTLKSFRSPTNNPYGLTFDGTYLWVSDRYRDEIYMVSPRDGSVIQILDSPGKYTFGLTYDKKNLWAVDSEDDKIYKLVKADKDNYRQTNATKVRVTHTHEATNFGPGKMLTTNIHLATPRNRKSQKIENISYNTKPTEMMTDHWGQQTARFHAINTKPGKTIRAEMTVDATLYDLRFFIDPAKVGKLDNIPEEITEKYLANNEKYQYNHPLMKEVLQKAIGEETNPYWMIRGLFNHLIDNMYYEMSGGWNTAPAVLERGNGSCSEYTFTFISLCRSAGIPARYVGSVVIRGDETAMDDVFHRWAQVYLPNYGWIPIDASRGDRKSPRDQADAIGHLVNSFVITTQSGGGSETMEWTYNSNAFYTTEPKTFVVTDHYADWQKRD